MSVEIRFPENLSEEEKRHLEEAFNKMGYSGCIEPNTTKERLKRIISRLLG